MTAPSAVIARLVEEVRPAPRSAAAWDTLESLLGLLQSDEQSFRRLPAVLNAMREGTGADAVYLDPGTESEPVQLVGAAELPPERCRALTARLLAGAPGVRDELLRVELAGDGSAGPQPVSAALVRMSQSRPVWMVALSFRPEKRFRPEDVRLMALARRMVANQRQQARAREQWQAALFALLHSLTTTLDAKEPHSAGHSRRVARVAVRLGRELGLPAEERHQLYLAGLLHDVGKVGVSDAVLGKPGELDATEQVAVRQHSVLGERMLAVVGPLQHLGPAVRGHHERWDGTGYPDRLAGRQIPALARILAVADAADAMLSPRPGRGPLTPPEVDAALGAGAGSQWDPRVVQAFLACAPELYELRQREPGESLMEAVARTAGDGEDRPNPPAVPTTP